jgi:hypothetical protein
VSGVGCGEMGGGAQAREDVWLVAASLQEEEAGSLAPSSE